MREISLDQLRTLVSVVDLGRFSAAARALHLAQPTVSLHISELEARLGTPLLTRGGARVTPTAAGNVLLERARRLLRDAADATDCVRRQAEGRAGRVRVGAPTGVLVHLLPAVLAAMARDYPGIDIDIAVVGSAEAMRRIADGSLDLGFVAMPQRPFEEVQVVHWRTDPMMAFVPAAWPAPKQVTPQWLAGRPLIFNDPSTHMYRQTMEWFAAGACAPRARMELNYTEAMKSLVAAGYGAAVLPLEDAALDHPGMHVLPLRPRLRREIGLAHRPPADIDGATQNLLKTLARFHAAARAPA